MIITHYITGKQVQPPQNEGAITIKRNFLSDTQTATFSAGGDLGSEEKVSFEWIEQAAAILQDIYAKGISGGAGVTEGVPHRITISEKGQTFELFNGYIDLKAAIFDRDYIAAESLPLGQIDWLNQVADVITFEMLWDEGILKPSDNVYVPYVINRIPNYTEIVLMQVTLLFVTIEITDVALRLTGHGVESGTIIDSLGGVIGLIFTIIYAVALLATLIKIILDCVNLLIQKLKYKSAMKLTRLMEAAAFKLGLTFQSDILNANPMNLAHIIPPSFVNPKDQVNPLLRGFVQPNNSLQQGYYRGTIGELFRSVKTMVNGRFTITGNVLKLVPRVPTITAATFKLPPIYNPRFTTNAPDMVANYNLSFEIDNNDLTTIDNYKGVSVSVNLQLKQQTDKRLFNLRGFVDNKIGFARAKRKFELTEIEQIASAILKVVGTILSAFLKAVNTVITVVNKALKLINKIKKALKTIGINIKADLPEIPKITDPKIGQLIEDRIGVMEVEQDITSVHKILLLNVDKSNPRRTKIPIFNDTFFTAKKLYETYHKTNSFAPTPQTAQRVIRIFENVEMSLADVQRVFDEQAVRLSDGTICEVRIIEYNPSTRLATLEVAEKRIFATNLKEKINEPTGIS